MANIEAIAVAIALALKAVNAFLIVWIAVTVAAIPAIIFVETKVAVIIAKNIFISVEFSLIKPASFFIPSLAELAKFSILTCNSSIPAESVRIIKLSIRPLPNVSFAFSIVTVNLAILPEKVLAD